MAKRNFELTETEKKELQRAERQTRDVCELKRLQAVRLYGEGHSRVEIEATVGCSWRALMDWCQRYREEGAEGLKSRWQGQNAAKLKQDQRAELKEKLHQYRPDQVIAPEVRTSQGKFWTISDLKIVVTEWYGVSYQSETSYQTLFRQCKLSLQVPESRYRSRPDDLTVADFEAALEKK
ncbi:MAG: helix-turn-helix domain-containing protein [Anaerolineae bacterium]|nr:helix-turn-helix domain-containing protein [Anaerolineae bacterium]